MKTGFETKAVNEPAGSQPAFVPLPVEEIAKLFPQLEIIELLGRGGMGAVYKARQPRLDRFVALKILAPEKQHDPQFAERFEREARALAWLTHPNIVAVYDFGEAQGNFYFLMEFVDGLTLRQLYQAKKLSPAEALHIIPQICEALQYAHEQGIVHRDIKPENILLDKNGRVKIADFGIAKLLDQAPQDLSLTGTSEVMGTVHYMAPEQIEKPQTVDCRADIYSLGVVFYEMLTGELPIGKFQPPSQKVQIDVRLDEVVLHALEKEPDRRYQKVSAMKTDVETITATPVQTVPSMPSTPAVAPSIPRAAPLPIKNSNGWKIAVAVGGFGLLVAIGIFCLVMLLAGIKQKPALATAADNLASSNAFWNLLNDDQRDVVQYDNRKFHNYFDGRSFDGWPDKERADLEKRLIDTFKAPDSDDLYRAINSLAALRSTNALPLLRTKALDPGPRLLRVEISNRPRWMAVRALGLMGDKTSVSKMIHLLYHNNQYVRWAAQISLVRLTGQNFGRDWAAWGKWWNEQKGSPPFDAGMVRWWRSQPEPAELEKELADGDRKFLENIQRILRKQSSPGVSTNAAIDSGRAQANTTPKTTTQTDSMTNTLDIDPGDGTKAMHNPTEADIRKAVASLRGDAEPGFLILHKDAGNMIQATCLAKDSFTVQSQEGDEQHQFQATKNLSADTTTKLLLAFRNGDPDWKKFADWKPM